MILAQLKQAEKLFDHLHLSSNSPRHVGRLASHEGGMLEVTGFNQPIGAGARLTASDGTVARAEVEIGRAHV